MEVTIKDLIYLYCVTNSLPHHLHTKDFGIGVYFIYHKGLYAVVSKVTESEFNEENLKNNLTNLEWIKTKVGIHERIIEEVMRDICVVPFKFATLFNNEDNLKAMFEEHAEELKTKLKHLEGKEEWGVKIYCDIEKLKENLIQEDEALLKISKEISASSPGKAFFSKKKKEELLNIAVNKKINEYGQYSFDRLREQSLKTRINKLLPKEVTERENDMILNSAFLVYKDKISDFISVVDILKAQYKGRGLFFDCTGPWPPYNFVTTGD
ncbi:MAG: GvpL/GvpF family gas vesicle protein [Nitrospirae bacterium]|nr:GvpL/GvpF family gas vesicle protein [Nitrospirota bacterium]